MLTTPPHDRATQRRQTSLAELAERIAHALPTDGVCQPLKGLHLARLSVPSEKLHSVLEASFCVIAQGSKEVFVGADRYVYDPDHYLLTTLELPRISQVLAATKTQPYLSFRLALDPQLVSSVIAEAEQQRSAPRRTADPRAIAVSPLTPDLLDAVLRLVRLAETPADAPMLLPLITREIIYRLLSGSQGDRLRHLSTVDSYTSAIAQAIHHIVCHFDQPLRIEQIARELGMSVSGFHSHFKAVTALSPLQFQKQLRLQEARRLMLSEHLDATSAGYRVGYSDAAHFSREYKSVFGVPPRRDVRQLRNIERVAAG